ncbi:MAG TPA: hypothetical protein VGI43_11720 [Mucilaginibacter sp.]|jgi:hypothetical protein
MKKLLILSAIAISGLIYNTADAQIRIHLGIGFAAPRVVYAPAPVVQQTPVYEQSAYNQNDDYYYLPDVDAYYSVNEQCYYYFNGDNWISAAYLPGEYHDYDWRGVRRFEVSAPRPYLHDDFYRSKYDGHQVEGWAHSNYNQHFDGGYANQGFRNSEQRFDNNRGNGFNQPAQTYRNDYRNNQHFDSRRQGNYGQPTQPNNTQRGYGQPSNQNGNGYRDMRSTGNNEHYAQSSPKGGLEAHRMARF